MTSIFNMNGKCYTKRMIFFLNFVSSLFTTHLIMNISRSFHFEGLIRWINSLSCMVERYFCDSGVKRYYWLTTFGMVGFHHQVTYTGPYSSRGGREAVLPLES